jgi:hypothetical protein
VLSWIWGRVIGCSEESPLLLVCGKEALCLYWPVCGDNDDMVVVAAGQDMPGLSSEATFVAD